MDFTLLDSSAAPSIVVDSSNAVRYVNTALCRRLGVKVAELPASASDLLTVRLGSMAAPVQSLNVPKHAEQLGDWRPAQLHGGVATRLCVEVCARPIDAETWLVSVRDRTGVDLTDVLDALPYRVYYTAADDQLLWINTAGAAKHGLPREQMLGAYPEGFVEDRLAARIQREKLEVIRSGQAGQFCSGSMRGAADGPAYNSEMLPVPQPDGSTNVVTVSVELAAENLLRDQAQTKNIILEHIARGTPLQDVLQALASYVRRFTSATCATILTIDPIQQTFSVASNDGLPGFVRDFLQGAPVAINSGPCGSAAVLMARQLYRDATDEPSVAAFADSLRQHAMRACCSEPIVAPSERVFGSIAVYFAHVGELSAEQIEVINSASLLAGIALERADVERVTREANEKLERRVKQRTTELRESVRELESARAEAERAMEAKTRFLAAASHDLRQPLQAMDLYLSVLNRDLSPEKNKELRGRIEATVDTMSGILESLMDITRLASGNVDGRKSSVSVDELFRRLYEAHTPAALSANLELELDSTEAFVHSSPNLLHRVLDNLIANAIAYTEVGKVTVACTADGDGWRIDVADTGVGIPEAQQQAVFDEYVQLQNPGRNRKKGTGLGLAVVKQLGRLLEHRIELQSEPDRGSVFSIYLDAAEKPSPVANKDAQTDGCAGKIKPAVLFVDDDEDVLDAMTRVFAGEGFNAQCYSSAKSALSAMQQGFKPDILVTDLHLVDLDGHGLTRLARNIVGEQLPVIVITGDAKLEGPQRHASNSLLLGKPVRSDVLIEHIFNETRPEEKQPGTMQSSTEVRDADVAVAESEAGH